MHAYIHTYADTVIRKICCVILHNVEVFFRSLLSLNRSRNSLHFTERKVHYYVQKDHHISCSQPFESNTCSHIKLNIQFNRFVILPSTTRFSVYFLLSWLRITFPHFPSINASCPFYPTFLILSSQ